MAQTPLHVAIVGAGIAGLSAAISIRRAGHIVDIYERSAFANEVGAAITVPPNASRPLLRWGLDPVAAKFVFVEEIGMHVPFTMKQVHAIPMGDLTVKRFGAPFFFAHRVDLHQELKRLATEIDGPETPANIHLKSEVVSYDPATPSLTLASGEVIRPDLVVAADGIHSTGLAQIMGKPNPPLPQEHYNSCYRLLIPASVLEEDPETAFFTKGIKGKMALYPDNDGQRRLVCYPCRNNEVYNFVGIHFNPQMKDFNKEDWQATASKDQMLQTFQGFHPDLIKVLSKATEIKCWPLLYRAPVSKWTRGKMVLTGDAAHPMLPHQGQGGAQALEDGVALGIALCGATVDDIPARLAAYEEIRINRASAIQVLSNAGQDQAHMTYKEAAKYVGSEDAVPKNPQAFAEFNFGHDVIEEAKRCLRKSNPAFEIPESFFKEPVQGKPIQQKPAQEKLAQQNVQPHRQERRGGIMSLISATIESFKSCMRPRTRSKVNPDKVV